MRPRVRSALISFSRLRDYAAARAVCISGHHLFA
jgi:hypothetical protein